MKKNLPRHDNFHPETALEYFWEQLQYVRNGMEKTMSLGTVRLIGPHIGLPHIYGIQKKMVLINLFAGQEQRHRHRECSHGHGKGREREGDMNWQHRTDIYTLPCVKQIANGKLLYNTGNSAWCSEMTQMGRMVRGG